VPDLVDAGIAMRRRAGRRDPEQRKERRSDRDPDHGREYRTET
jgi:hypothetical protein